MEKMGTEMWMEATEQSIPKGQQIYSLEFYEKGLWGKEKEGLNQDQNTPTLDFNSIIRPSEQPGLL